MIDLTLWPNGNDILDRALELAPQERRAFLSQAAAGNPELLRALEAVVAELSRDDGFLDPGGAMAAIDDHEPEAIADAPAALAPGGRIEHYVIIEVLGHGGMGEVYRARDTRLERDVAIKVLPARFLGDPARIARLRREARVLASLSHPGIGAIYGLAQEGDQEALVLEYVEGPTLAERLNAGPMPFDEVVVIGRNLAEAVEAAHARRIFHRDLKPANIKVAPDGSVKILDFGLAKALAPDPAAPSPDLTAQAPHVLLGTAAYMSPEQVRGQDADERADIWAFGCVLFEMLTGTRAFAAQTIPETLARVIEREPAFGLLPIDTPASIRRLLRRTLEKDPRRRLGYIGDALLEFDEAATPALDLPAQKGSTWRLAALATITLVVGAGLATMFLRPGTPPRPPASRFVIPLAAGDAPVTGFQPAVALSPNGRTIVYRARRNGVVQLFRRDLDNLDGRPIPGTELSTGPFFSPDGRWLAFDNNGVLKRLSLAGGAPVAICPAPGNATATWVGDDTIVFATNTGRVLQRVSASGGTPVPVTTLDRERGDTLHLLPQALPDGKSVLFTITSGSARRIAVVRLDTNQTQVIAEGTHARYLATGHLIFWREGSMWAAPFDLDRLTLSAPPIPLLDGVENTDGTVFHFAVAEDGSLVYLPTAAADPVQLVWIDRTGKETPAGLEPRQYTRFSLSPDGSRVAAAIEERGNTDIWIGHLARGTLSRLTFDATIETAPRWTPDGRSVVFRSERQGPGIFIRDAQAAGGIERLTETQGPIHSPAGWTPDGRTLLFALFRSFGNQAIAAVTPPDRTVRVLLDGDFAQVDAQVSQDGRWLVYQSNESGRPEIYVRPYPDIAETRWQVSLGGGTSPRWSRDGRRLFFLGASGVMSVTISPTSRAFTHDSPRLLVQRQTSARVGLDFDVSSDGQRFLFVTESSADRKPAHFVLIQQWAAELRERLAQADQPQPSP
jgi:serine/threonine-protein kinase